jgi:hypothetical protein
MKTYRVVFVVLFLHYCINVNAQQNNSKQFVEDAYRLPCYISEHPKIITLPDSFNYKQKMYYAIFYVTSYFDSSGNLLKIYPQQLLIKNKITNDLMQGYIYWKGWEDSAINISKTEIERYATWTEKALPQYVCLRRSPFRCDEAKTNRIVRMLELRLE